jgi:3'-phosphoadenosine 5'-phosphosulfate synthase
MSLQRHEDFINRHPIVQQLRYDGLAESRPHEEIPLEYRDQNLFYKAFLEAGKLEVAPFVWRTSRGEKFVLICYLGPQLCCYPGVVHGGFLAALLDDSFARCCAPALPHNIGMTATLSVNYKAPVLPQQYVMLKAEITHIEGRKALVKGCLETLTEDGSTGMVLVEATSLFVSPKQAAVSSQIGAKPLQANKVLSVCQRFFKTMV